MENSITANAELTERCGACDAHVLNDDVYCTGCGYPLKGSEKDQKTFFANQEVLNIDLAEFNKKIKTAGNSLYYLAGIFLLSAIVNFFMSKDDPDVLGIVIPIVILAILFLVLGAYSAKKPLACIVSGLCLYIIVQVLLLIGDPATIARGIFFKIVIIGYMIKGIKSALELEKFKKENNIA